MSAHPLVAVGLAAALAAACIDQREYVGASRANAPADELVFNNGTEPEYIDPGQATGQPDGRIIRNLFDGLTENDPVDLGPVPSLATHWDTHPDGAGYTFHLRDGAKWSDGHPVTAHDFAFSWYRLLDPVYGGRFSEQAYTIEGAKRFNQRRGFVLREAVGDLPTGTRVVGLDSGVVLVDGAIHAEPSKDSVTVSGLPEGATAFAIETRVVGDGDDDATWTKVRFRPDCPDLAQLAELQGCGGIAVEAWTTSAEPTWPAIGQRLVVADARLEDAEVADTLHPGDLVTLVSEEADRVEVFFFPRDRFGWIPRSALADPLGPALTYEVAVQPDIDWAGTRSAAVDPDPTSSEQDSGSAEPAVATPPSAPPAAAPAPAAPRTIRVRADQLAHAIAYVGFRARDDLTLDVRLEGVAPYFLQQTSHTAMRSTPKWAIARHGPSWTRVENIVTNGPYRLSEHRIRDKFVMVKDPEWWGAADVRIDKVTALSIDNLNASLNLYYTGYTDYVVAGDIPIEYIRTVKTKKDYRSSPAMTVYFYRVNTTRPPFDDLRVRRALAMAMPRDAVVEMLGRGDLPADHLVPPGMAGYEGPQGPMWNPEGARALLAEAGFPGGKGFPTFEILYNTSEAHKLVAAKVQDTWKRELGIDVQLKNQEWATYLKDVHSMNYTVVRAGWIGDYVDPTTFLGMFVTGGGNNETGWSNLEYDALIEAATREPDPDVRIDMLERAEGLLVDEMPILPIYWYVWAELLQPDVRGNHANLLDVHPIRFMWLERGGD